MYCTLFIDKQRPDVLRSDSHDGAEHCRCLSVISPRARAAQYFLAISWCSFWRCLSITAHASLHAFTLVPKRKAIIGKLNLHRCTSAVINSLLNSCGQATDTTDATGRLDS